jgi:hypothetical protein
MAELAKTHIEIIDESTYGSGTSTVIPLYVFATAENKVIDEDTGEIAPGTTKSTANEVMLLTSQSDVVETYGVPQFTTIDGTVQQGDELNEVGLYALYSGLGASALAYGLRADIDLGQLVATKEEPTSEPKANTLWLDKASTSFGLFRANGNRRPAIAWDRIDGVLTPSDDYIDETGKPAMTYGSNGDVCVVCLNNEIKFYENIAQAWYEIGSRGWKDQFPATVKATVASGVTVKTESVISVMGKELTVPAGSNANAVKELINEAGIVNVLATYEDGVLSVANTAEAILMIEKSGTALEDLGFELNDVKQVVVGDNVSVVFGSHTKIPSGENAGSIWVKTTEPNYGASYVMKKYSKTSKSWTSSVLPMYGTYLEAEEKGSAMIVKYDENTVSEKIMKFVGGVNAIEATAAEELTNGDVISIKTIVDGAIQTYLITVYGKTVEDLVTYINKAKIENVSADVYNKALRIVSSSGNTIELANVKGNILEKCGLAEGEYTNGNWIEVSYESSNLEPTTEPEIGTLWFNDDYKFDIMVNDGQQWLGYKNMYPCADIIVNTEEPETKEEGSDLQEYDLWIDTNDTEYPTIYRYFDGEWEVVDNTDQSTGLGVVYADARENAGPAYTGSKHVAFSEESDDLMISNYVDPDCVNPLSYPGGILLFNTMYSTNNIKSYNDKYVDGVKTYGETFTVGKSSEFATPGSTKNVKTTRWSTASGNDLDGSGLFGRKAQRKMVVKALAEAINSNEDIRSDDYDFYFINCAGYPELDDEIKELNVDKKEMFYNVSDTPARLAPKASEVTAWATNKNNANSHGEDGRIIYSAYQTRQYPSMALTTNVDGSEIAVPSSVVKMYNLLTLPRGRIAAGTQYGQVSNASSVGYINDENEYTAVSVKDSLGEVLVSNSINPIMPRRNAGLLIWGEATENSYTSALSDEHTIIMLLRLKRELEAACQPFFFQLNTQSVRNDFDASLRSILNDYMSREEIYDFTLVTDTTVNTSERIERKELWAEIALEPTKSIEQIYLPIRIVKTGSLSSSN